MKILIIPDVHWSQNSSIVRSEGTFTSTRLHNLINSMNWVEELAINAGCELVVGLGDFFDSTQLNSKEISALQHINWAKVQHIFITGNHETSVGSLDYSTSEIFKLLPSTMVVNSVQTIELYDNTAQLVFLPYVLERDRLPLLEYLPKDNACRNRVIFSHNDLKDVQYGPFLSKEGFSVEEIEANCDLFINGHIHNCSYVTPKILNSGNLTGQNFTEDAFTYDHYVQILDTETMQLTFYVNPYAFNFYKIDVTKVASFEGAVRTMFSSQLKPNPVLTLKVLSKDVECARQLLSEYPHIICRLIVEQTNDASNIEEQGAFEAVDHLKQFEEYALSSIGDNELVRYELNRVMGV